MTRIASGQNAIPLRDLVLCRSTSISTSLIASGKAKDRATFVKRLAGVIELMPDMSWKTEVIFQSGNKLIVDGHASATPKGTFFGGEPSGGTCEIMSIDIHAVENGKIV